jgi:hypothetical protein
MTRRTVLGSLLAGASPAAAPAGFRAGVARLRITPEGPIWMAGYASRKHPSEGVAADLWAKALALEDGRKRRVVIVTWDLLRVPRIVSEPVAAEVERRFGLGRAQLLMNCSHNHSGPLLWENDRFTALAPEEYARCRRYTEKLIADLPGLVGAALARLEPAEIRYGVGEATFGANRRVKTPRGYQIAYNPDGVTDRRVPVLRVAGKDGKLRAALFGYACHNTAIGGLYQICGDYAGFAQAEIERAHAGSTAMFLQLCAGDQDPHPRGEMAAAERHGKELAESVERVLGAKMQRLSGRIGSAYRDVDLALAPHTRELFESRLKDAEPARVRNARAMLAAYDEGKPMRALPYPVQALRIGGEVAVVGIGGEPVADYGLRASRELPGVILAGYSNSVRGYVPSRRVLAEGGYEAGDSAIYYGLPGPFTSEVEDTIFAAIREVLRRAAA